jgi:hypothetical protein
LSLLIRQHSPTCIKQLDAECVTKGQTLTPF